MTEQQTFGDTSVKQHTDNHLCDSMVKDEETGEIVRCTYTATIEINRRGEPTNKYCCVHANDTWLEMAGLD
jgi:hypothetical protein